VLVIDDSKDITEVMNTYCESVGIDCVIANNGAEGLRTIRERKFDLILLDMAMPEFSGVDVVESLNSEDLLKTNNIVIFTASSDSTLIEHLKNSGIKETLKKPLSFDELTSFIEKYRPPNESQ
jgi:two-component system, OmpR family, response regulator